MVTVMELGLMRREMVEDWARLVEVYLSDRSNHDSSVIFAVFLKKINRRVK